jgi:catechol 2,3-dioxygenase-like lactoylglutathione lyase family enzyme
MAFSCVGANHVGLTVSDLDRAVSFFCDCMGFKERDRSDRDPVMAQRITGLPDASVTVTYVDGPGIVVELIAYGRPVDRALIQGRPCDTGYAHLALNVVGIEEVLEAAGKYGFRLMGELVSVSNGPNARRRAAYLKDSDGITIELIESGQS